jgi:hypothetical protein
MTPDSPVIAELRPLLDALCDQTITPEQLQHLEELVLTHPEAEAFYVQYMSFAADVARAAARLPRPAQQAAKSSENATAPTEPRPATDAARAVKRWRLSLAWCVAGFMGLAAVLLLVLGVWPRNQSVTLRNAAPPAVIEPSDDTVAVLLSTHHAQWEDTGMPGHAGAPLPPGRLLLKSGYAQIEFYNGATVILQGPAEFRLISRTEGYCASGKLRAVVPPQAQGFRIGSPTLNLIDRGTEFALDVEDKKTAVHVFQGKVELYDPTTKSEATPRKELKKGEGVAVAPAGVMAPIDPPKPGEFLTASELADQSAKEVIRRQQEWLRASEVLRQDPDLLFYSTFQGEEQWTRTLLDISRNAQQPHNGAIVGCVWGPGRWQGRQGLEFKRVSDRVRVNIPGEFRSLTFAAWVRPDALPNQNNSLLMADGWDVGKPHWQIGSDGTVILGVQGPPEYQTPNLRGAHYHAPAVITPERFGRWVHLAVVYDREAHQVAHYVDGRQVTLEPTWFDVPLRLGNAEIGNWNVAGYRNKTPIRNFNGGIDEFLMFSRALNAEEVARLYASGRPGS